MLILVNGKEVDVKNEIALLDFLKEKAIDPEKVVIEYNGEILSKDDYGNIIIKEKDKMEILRFVGGG